MAVEGERGPATGRPCLAGVGLSRPSLKELTVFRKTSRAGGIGTWVPEGREGGEETQCNCTRKTWTRLWEVEDMRG